MPGRKGGGKDKGYAKGKDGKPRGPWRGRNLVHAELPSDDEDPWMQPQGESGASSSTGSTTTAPVVSGQTRAPQCRIRCPTCGPTQWCIKHESHVDACVCPMGANHFPQRTVSGRLLTSLPEAEEWARMLAQRAGSGGMSSPPSESTDWTDWRITREYHEGYHTAWSEQELKIQGLTNQVQELRRQLTEMKESQESTAQYGPEHSAYHENGSCMADWYTNPDDQGFFELLPGVTYGFGLLAEEHGRRSVGTMTNLSLGVQDRLEPRLVPRPREDVWPVPRSTRDRDLVLRLQRWWLRCKSRCTQFSSKVSATSPVGFGCVFSCHLGRYISKNPFGMKSTLNLIE